ncbi:hypothetical protein EDB89DRAFT_1340197 [Lactarius sanguifluus]|nr:hypothetical protein EDB89DRAFT_1340197 [Lactarius sanguifluus]
MGDHQTTHGALADILIAVAMTLLLRRASGNFSSFVLIRVVRLTIETNALSATLVITTLVLFAAFPVSRTEIRHDSSIDPITSFTERAILHIHVCSCSSRCTLPANEK